MKILVTGGTGYIGSHTCVELLNNDYEVVIIDNLENSNIGVLDKIKQLTGKDIKFYENDCRDKEALRKIFNENKIDAVIHFAGYKAVGESVEKPIKYYENNIQTTLSLLEVMQEYNCNRIVFSSTATVYGRPEEKDGKVLPFKEIDKVGDTENPYATTKYFIERILKDTYISNNNLEIVILRYFNPIGAHESGLIGENPNGRPNNLMPYILKVANKELPYLNIFGNDYNTKDGTGVRDYLHVVDLAKGHIKALEHIKNGVNIYNLGTGIGYSVLDIVNTFEKVNNIKLDYKIAERRKGDIAEYFSDPTKALNELNWKAEKTIEDMCRDSYNFIKNFKK